MLLSQKIKNCKDKKYITPDDLRFFRMRVCQLVNTTVDRIKKVKDEFDISKLDKIDYRWYLFFNLYNTGSKIDLFSNQGKMSKGVKILTQLCQRREYKVGMEITKFGCNWDLTSDHPIVKKNSIIVFENFKYEIMH